MKLVRTVVPKMKKLALLLACSPFLLLLAEPAHPQAVTQTPAALTFGIPFVPGTPPVPPQTSAEQAVTVTITSGSVTFSTPSAAITGTNAEQFSVTKNNSCQGTMTAPASCQVGVTFSSNSSSLQTASLQITGSGFELSAVPLSGAYGAIKLFDATTVAASVSGASFDNIYTIGSKGLNLSCPAVPVPVAVLSSTPNGLDTLMSGEPAGIGNVLVDNYISLSINNTPVQLTVNGIPNSPAGNVCQGSDAAPDNFGGTFQQECFSAAYRSFVSSLIGQNTDAITAAGNSLLNGAAGGIPYLNVSTFFPSGSEVEASVSMEDAGGDVASSTLFLVTDCTQTGIVPGGTITGNPITAGNPASQTQTFTFDSSPGQNISFTSSEQEAIQQTPSLAPNGTVPQVTNFGIRQELFDELVMNTSAGPAVCLRMTGEVDPTTGRTLCKAFKIVCVDPATGLASGDNCVSGSDTARNLYDSAQFASPDAPTGVNFLQSACDNFLFVTTGQHGTCAASSPPGPNPTTLIGPGFLLGSDNWLTQNSAPPLYSSTNCTFIGTLAGDLCPLDTLTQFRGAADPLPGGRTGGRNTLYVPVVNKPLPFTDASIQGQMNGWVTSDNVTVNFTSNAATYNPTATNPPSNGFMAAAPYSLTYGISSASVPVPDPTYEVPGDTPNYNDPYVKHNFGAPLCQAGTPASFTSSAVFSRAEGLYNLHYFTTDCALTEELLFNPTQAQLTDPTANWASFPVLTFGVDTTSPTISVPVVSVSTSGSITTITATYTCSDTGSKIVNSGVAQCGPFSQALSGTPLMGPSSVNVTDTTFPTGPHTVTVKVTDAAGNTASSAVTYNIFNIIPLYNQNQAVNSGATIPIKMYLASPTGKDLSSASIIVHATGLFQMSTNTSKPVVASGTANPGNNFRFNSTLGPSGGYIFNLSTTGLGKGKWVIQFTVGSDPTIYALGFGIN